MGYDSIFGTKDGNQVKKRYADFKAELKAIDHKDSNFDAVVGKLENVLGENGCAFTERGKYTANEDTRTKYDEASFFIFVDPRFLAGKKSESSASFYKLKDTSEGFIPEKITFKDVLALYGVKKPQKPALGFFGTIRNFFKKYDSMKKYDRELEVYNAKKSAVLNNKLGFKDIKYNENLVDKKVAEKYINEGVVDTSLKKPEAREKAVYTMDHNIVKAAEELYEALEKEGMELTGGAELFRTKISDCFCKEAFAKSEEGVWLQNFIMKGKRSIVDERIPKEKVGYFMDFCKKFDEGTQVVCDFWKAAPGPIKEQMTKENAYLDKNDKPSVKQNAPKSVIDKFLSPTDFRIAAETLSYEIKVSGEDRNMFPINVGDCVLSAEFMKSEEGKWMEKFLLDGKALIDEKKFSKEKNELYSDFCVRFNKAIPNTANIFESGKKAQAMIKEFREVQKDKLAEPQQPLIGPQ